MQKITVKVAVDALDRFLLKFSMTLAFAGNH